MMTLTRGGWRLAVRVFSCRLGFHRGAVAGKAADFLAVCEAENGDDDGDGEQEDEDFTGELLLSLSFKFSSRSRGRSRPKNCPLDGDDDVDLGADAEGLNEGAVVVVQVFTDEQRCQQKFFTLRLGSGVERCG